MRVYESTDLVVYWYPELCAHVAFCIRALPSVFDTTKRPWVNIGGAAPEDIIKAIDTCPSGALRYSLPAGSKVRACMANGPGSIDYVDKSTVTTIRASKKGPLLVEGPVTIQDMKGRLIKEASRVTLCQCGMTGNHPFCDGSHRADIREKRRQDQGK